jgi:peroxiredoxin Q/BCP
MPKLEVGMEAPDFELSGQDGKIWRLSDLRGRKVIVYFYPADDTPGCTAEACDFRDALGDLKDLGYEVLGISPQNVESKRAFSSKYGLNFPLLAVVGGKVADAYGARGEREIWNNIVLTTKRSTFVVDEDGKIAAAHYNVRAKGHVDRIKQELATTSS